MYRNNVKKKIEDIYKYHWFLIALQFIQSLDNHFSSDNFKKEFLDNKQQNFNLIYGSEQEINEAIKLMTMLKQKNIQK